MQVFDPDQSQPVTLDPKSSISKHKTVYDKKSFANMTLGFKQKTNAKTTEQIMQAFNMVQIYHPIGFILKLGNY
jgi:hypothetical protein